MHLKHLLVIPLLLSAGCVTAGKYDALQAEKLATDQQLAEAQKGSAELRAALEKEKVRSKSLSESIAKREAELAAMLKDKSSLQASVGEMQSALAELQRRKAEADGRIAEFRGLLTRFKSLIDAGKLKVKMSEGRMVVELPTDVLFGSGQANISKEGKAAIAEVSQALASISERRFQVEGHTDNVPIATALYPSNWELASARALMVVKTMVEAGLPADRISAASFSEFKPVRANDTPENKAANRRIEIVVVPDLSGLPGFDELRRAAGTS
jgi:chemotaxis protein MotB